MIAPTIFVLVVAVFREAVEDMMRYKQDLKTNSLMVDRLTGEDIVEQISAKAIKVGDIIKLLDGQEVPADVIMI